MQYNTYPHEKDVPKSPKINSGIFRFLNGKVRFKRNIIYEVKENRIMPQGIAGFIKEEFLYDPSVIWHYGNGAFCL